MGTKEADSGHSVLKLTITENVFTRGPTATLALEYNVSTLYWGTGTFPEFSGGYFKTVCSH